MSLVFQNLSFHILKRKPCCFWYIYFIIFNCAFLCRCLSFNPSLCCLLPFLLSYVTVSSSCCLSEFDPNMALFINSNESFFLYDCVLCPPSSSK